MKKNLHLKISKQVVKKNKQHIYGGLRWFGKKDPLSLLHLKQAGAEMIISALHDVPLGEVWEASSIKTYQKEIAKSGLEWKVVESLPVHETIKYQGLGFEVFIEKYKKSIENLSSCGINTITYNFMPVLDWVRTDHHFINQDKTTTLRFDPVAMAYFDCFILNRSMAQKEYDSQLMDEVKKFAQTISEKEREQLKKNVLLGLPGNQHRFTIGELKEKIIPYQSINASQLRENLIYFLREIIPVAKACGVNLAIHPDDPPFSILGLPRIVSTSADLDFLFTTLPEIENGLCFCSGSLGATDNNDLNYIFNSHQSRIHFLHFRNVDCFPDGSFNESAHLSGDHNMRNLVQLAVDSAKQRKVVLPFRPDHGFLQAFEKQHRFYPGYSLLGRMQGLASLKGLVLGLS